ncbi:UDP-2,3-diacylglucosamine diphosphatase [Psychrobacter lutiphocae]|uniref:UDP-2,3-diacylglucosamine diphosphatase n=1 Tax=Psychrobacter lutiphocae TaxID=540500 RepID=UPI0003716877|nr:UDP-2,3-diacylglucosamine diphosphatase [Psychrobacter lutiphocae]
MTNADSVIATLITDYNHLLTTRPHDIRRVLISDLHLSADEPALVQAFLALLDDLLALPNLIELYILGDWFDAWVGDDAYLSLSDTDKSTHWLTPIIDKLTQLKHAGCQTLVMHGNRDFLIGQDFCDCFGGRLIHEPFILTLGDTRFRFEHGDALCTDDLSYQRFRRVTRNRAVQWLFLKQPLTKRLNFANKVRHHSTEDKAHKPMAIMDVNDMAVNKALQHVDHLLHGHTHRPDIHQVSDDHSPLHTNKKTKLLSKFSRKKTCSNSSDNSNNSQYHNRYRYVLGDWRVNNRDSARQRVEAVIAFTTVDSFEQLNLQNQAHTQKNKQKNTQTNKSAQSGQWPNERLQLVNFVH